MKSIVKVQLEFILIKLKVLGKDSIINVKGIGYKIEF